MGSKSKIVLQFINKHNSYLVILMAITIVGAFLRFLAFSNNDIPHGDIHLDYAVAWNLLKNGRLIIPFISAHTYPNTQIETGYPLDQHAPLWPILGGLGALLFGNIYKSFKLITLIFGILLIPLSYLAFYKAYGKLPALFSCVLISLTYILIDYSGNGSLYIIHAFLFILFVIAIKTDNILNSILLGILIGVSYLLNYQALILSLALITVYIAKYGVGNRLIEKLPFLLVSLGSAFIVVSPWLIRNINVFGQPLYNVNYEYVIGKLGVNSELTVVNGRMVLSWFWDEFSYTSIFGTLLKWVIRNLIYLSGRIIILAPIVSFFALLEIYHVFKHHQLHHINEGALSVLVLLIFHIIISCLWPVFKFRYFVPLLPLLIGMGVYGIFRTFRQKKRLILILTLVVFSFIVVDVITYLRVPSHTNYYDSNDLFRYRFGEADWQIRERLLIGATSALDDESPGSIIGSVEIFYYTHRPLVIATGISDQKLIRFLVEKHDVKYIIDDTKRESFYQEFLDVDVIYQNDGYVLLNISESSQNNIKD